MGDKKICLNCRVALNRNFDELNIEKNSRFIIQRILERGNESEINELIKLYSKALIKTELSTIANSISPDFDRNIKRYI